MEGAREAVGARLDEVSAISATLAELVRDLKVKASTPSVTDKELADAITVCRFNTSRVMDSLQEAINILQTTCID